MYNHTYRQDKESQYTYENVCIVPGGRAGLSRVAAVVGDVYCGYQVPEYTTYSEVSWISTPKKGCVRCTEQSNIHFLPGVVRVQAPRPNPYSVSTF